MEIFQYTVFEISNFIALIRIIDILGNGSIFCHVHIESDVHKVVTRASLPSQIHRNDERLREIRQFNFDSPLGVGLAFENGSVTFAICCL